MLRQISRTIFVVMAAELLLLSTPLAIAQDRAAPDGVQIEELVVTSKRREQPLSTHAGNIALLDGDTVRAVGHHHIQELMTRVAGVWINRASGQEHLTAIRSPVLTGAGSCGGFLNLEDGIPIRPAGFCNVNQMFELVTEQAQRIEIIRGPGNALYGSNALHGIVNVMMPMPDSSRSPHVAFELGSNDFFRVRGEVPFDDASRFLASGVFVDDGGFRDDAGYRQAKLHLKAKTDLFGGELIAGLSATSLDQETAGFIIGQDAYRDPDINRSNPNPEAFRDAQSQRLYGLWSRAGTRGTLDVRPYLRRSDMEFLQHFLPGQPLEENGHVSLGVITTATFDRGWSMYVWGLDLEFSDSFLKQTQFGPTEGSDFLRETRPEGKHYDYEVRTVSAAPFIQGEWDASDRLRFHAGVRAEYLRHDYDNLMSSGNARDDGTPCGFGGCLYTRPGSRSDSFTNIAPKLSVTFEVSENATAYANLARGFRAPQATELYRLQSGQAIADLDSERIDSLELGLRTAANDWSFDIAGFLMRKRNSVLRDSSGFNVSNGRSRHDGVETEFTWRIHPHWHLSANVSYGHHAYDFDLVAARGETFVSGRDVDTAPRWLGNVDLLFQPNDYLDANLQLTALGKYYLDAENRFTYPGHEILNLRLNMRLTRSLDITARLNNVTDELIADRADYAFGNYRYLPGRGRELFLELRYTRRESL